MDEKLKLVVTQEGLNVFQRIYAAATNESTGFIVLIFLGLFFVLGIIILIVSISGHGSPNTDLVKLAMVPLLISIISLVSFYAAGNNIIGRGHYASGDQMTVTDVKNDYSNTVEPEYMGSTITGLKDGKKVTLETLPEKAVHIKRALLNEGNIQMKENQIKKGDVITIRTDDMYLSKKSWKSLDTNDLQIYPKVHIIK